MGGEYPFPPSNVAQLFSKFIWKVVKMSVSLKEEAGVKVGQILSDRFTFSTGGPRNVG